MFGFPNYLPAVPRGADNEVMMDDHHKELKRIWGARTDANSAALEELLKLTMPARRASLITACPRSTVAEVVEEYPMLKQNLQFLLEFSRISNFDLFGRLAEYLEQYANTILELESTSKSAMDRCANVVNVGMWKAAPQHPKALSTQKAIAGFLGRLGQILEKMILKLG